jgi:hypothetical protein
MCLERRTRLALLKALRPKRERGRFWADAATTSLLDAKALASPGHTAMCPPYKWASRFRWLCYTLRRVKRLLAVSHNRNRTRRC